ncbi:hypothetical protein EDB84DRAFT_347286 [Lactarius hengduanensis]|nr:hypothetical protein EDB84DRAFT_347286 [Lactarius hengduanensis]
MSRAYISIVVVILALLAQVQQHVVPRRKSSTYSCASCFRRLQQRTGETSIISAHENQAFPMTTFALRPPKQPTYLLPYLLTYDTNWAPCMSHRPSSRSSRRVRRDCMHFAAYIICRVLYACSR